MKTRNYRPDQNEEIYNYNKNILDKYSLDKYNVKNLVINQFLDVYLRNAEEFKKSTGEKQQEVVNEFIMPLIGSSFLEVHDILNSEFQEIKTELANVLVDKDGNDVEIPSTTVERIESYLKSDSLIKMWAKGLNGVITINELKKDSTQVITINELKKDSTE